MSVTVDGNKYHIAIKKGGTTYGFMIVKGSDTRQRVNDWAPIYSTGDQQFAEGTWQPWALTDWTGGLSQERYNNAEQNKFYGSTNCETRIAGRATLGGRWSDSDVAQVATAKPIDFGPGDSGFVLVPCGEKLRRYPMPSGPWSTANDGAGGRPGDFAADIVHAHLDGGLVYLALGPGADAYKMDASLAFTQLPAGIRASCWASYGGKLWRGIADNHHIFGSTDAGANWPTDVPIGDASSKVTFMLPYNQKLYIGKEDGLWSYDGVNTVRVLDFAQQAYVDNFRGMCEWGGSLYFQVLRRVIRFTPTNWADITPELQGDANKETYGYGMPVGFAALPSMLLVAFKGGENQYANVLAYTGSSWHRVYGPVVTTMNAVGYSRKKSWIMVNDGTTRCLQQIAQADRCSPDYANSGELVTPWFDGGYPFFKKSGKSLTLETRDCSTTETISVSYQTVDGGAWTPLASNVVSSEGPTSISLDALNGAIEFYKIRFKIVFARGSDVSKRPVLTAFILHYLNRPASVFAYSVTVKLSSAVRTLAA